MGEIRRPTLATCVSAELDPPSPLANPHGSLTGTFPPGNPDDLRGCSSRLSQAVLHVLAPLAACLLWLRLTGAV